MSSGPNVEYKMIVMDTIATGFLAERLNKEAVNGWRAHTILPEKYDNLRILMEREVRQP